MKTFNPIKQSMALKKVAKLEKKIIAVDAKRARLKEELCMLKQQLQEERKLCQKLIKDNPL